MTRSKEELEALYEELDKTAKVGGYNLNPDREFTMELVDGLAANEDRYGYMACPCRLASGDREKDMDIICPCDYREEDLSEYDTCFCGLYVTDPVVRGEKKITSIPERRTKDRGESKPVKKGEDLGGSLSYPVWRCQVCGYLCAKDAPPAKCPVCKVPKERFETFV